MPAEKEPPWKVLYTAKAKKQKSKLPQNIASIMLALQWELALEGPEQPEWRNYGKIVNKKDVYHCHLNNGRPRYVVIWKVTDWTEKRIEVLYADTHENADYRRIG